MAWLEEFIVSSERQRSVIGKDLISSLEAWAKTQGVVLSGLATRTAPELCNAIGDEESANLFSPASLVAYYTNSARLTRG